MTEAASSHYAGSSVSTADIILSVLKSAKYKMTQGEVIKAVQSIDPTVPRGTISKYLSRFATSNRYPVARTDTRPYLYYYVRPKKEKPIDYEFQPFWDPNLPLFIHRVMIMLENVPVRKTENIEVHFFDYLEPIKFSFNANTRNVRIDFKCSEWKKALDCFQFDAFVQTLETVLQLKGLGKYAHKMRLVNVDFNQDIEFVRIAGANYVSVQAFRNSLLVMYNKGTGHRREQQFNELNIPLDRARAQLSRKSTELKIGTVFNRTNLVLDEIVRCQGKINRRFNQFYDYSMNLLNEQDQQLYQLHQVSNQLAESVSLLEDNQLQLASLQKQSVSAMQQLVRNQLVTNEMLRDHDENIENRINVLQEDIELIKAIRRNIVRSDHVQDKILQQLEQNDKTIEELSAALNLKYNTVYYHVKKLQQKKKIYSYADASQQGRGRKKRKYTIHKERSDEK